MKLKNNHRIHFLCRPPSLVKIDINAGFRIQSYSDRIKAQLLTPPVCQSGVKITLEQYALFKYPAAKRDTEREKQDKEKINSKKENIIINLVGRPASP